MPTHELIPRWKIDLLETVYNGVVTQKHPDWDNQMRLAREQLATALGSRPRTSITNAKPRYVGVSRM